MTLKMFCKCGSEFYFSSLDENDEMKCWVRKAYIDFLSLHKHCFKDVHVKMPDLPEDWKV